jgi:hypothetical protein
MKNDCDGDRNEDNGDDDCNDILENDDEGDCEE